ncbi:hypothetical protein QF035_000313 [Streptomyces umbrinus]|uniref:Uncharacterized protein n=1 Tax=Streptomyces umbrinus TaxID=67370 RepID=A0ABU0SGP3_9ACTN|nr:hypothetical protein [Streptomyces umbrinus]MDQ1022731.1 hypothetical protein [Streptomyces umbrinus]
MSDAMVMRYSGWTFAFDGRSLTITRRGMPWRRKRVEHLPLSRLRACYLLKSEVHGGESLNFWLVYDTDLVHIGLNRQYYEDDAYWFAGYLSEAIREGLRWIFQNTIGLGPHSEPELLRVVRRRRNSIRTTSARATCLSVRGRCARRTTWRPAAGSPVRPGPPTCRPTTTARWTTPHRTSRTGGP